MRILLAQNASYCPALGGANKSNRVLLEALSGLGHECRVVATAMAGMESTSQGGKDDFTVLSSSEDAAVLDCKGIVVHAVKTRATMDSAGLRRELLRQMQDFAPDWILVSTEDVGHVLLEVAVNNAAARVIYLARTTLYLPFGPDCFSPSQDKTALLRRAAGIIAVGDYLKDYFRSYADLHAEVLPISLFGDGPFPNYANFDSGYITLINPCAYKGISIFLDLARSFPHLNFAAVPTWGTTSEDMRAMMELKNVVLLDPVDDINKIFAKTRVMLVPSLWAEAKSRTVVEAMLRGLPVLASDVGGNPEAKLGVEYVLPVKPIQGYQQLCDERSLPVTQVPAQDVVPWRDALRRLLSDRAHYDDISHRSRTAAHAYLAARGGSEKVAEYLQKLLDRRSGASGEASNEAHELLASKVPLAAHSHDALASLTPAQKALLSMRLKQKAREKLSES